MKLRDAFAMMLPMLLAVTSFGQKSQQAASTSTNVSVRDEAAITGVWRGELEGQPWTTLTLTNDGGQLSGAIVFYLHKREPGGQLMSTPSAPEPLLNPHFDGGVLTFAVSHRRAHPPGSLTDAPTRLKMEFTDKDHATLVNLD
jgi:hypothetical protein